MCCVCAGGRGYAELPLGGEGLLREVRARPLEQLLPARCRCRCRCQSRCPCIIRRRTRYGEHAHARARAHRHTHTRARIQTHARPHPAHPRTHAHARTRTRLSVLGVVQRVPQPVILHIVYLQRGGATPAQSTSAPRTKARPRRARVGGTPEQPAPSHPRRAAGRYGCDTRPLRTASRPR